MNKIQKNQKGFAHVETLLLLVIVAIIIGIGWFVWHTQQQANKSYDAASAVNLNTPASKKTSKSALPNSKSTSKTSPSLISYTGTNNASGVDVQSDADIDKLDGASDSFKQFIKDNLHKNSNSPSPCGNAYGIFVMKIYKDQFALGSAGACGGAQKLWAKVAENWTEVSSTQNSFDCSVLEQYKVPSAIVDQCTKNGQLVKNTRE